MDKGNWRLRVGASGNDFPTQLIPVSRPYGICSHIINAQVGYWQWHRSTGGRQSTPCECSPYICQPDVLKPFHCVNDHKKPPNLFRVNRLVLSYFVIVGRVYVISHFKSKCVLYCRVLQFRISLLKAYSSHIYLIRKLYQTKLKLYKN